MAVSYARAMPIHLRAEPDDYAPAVLVPGDPNRAKYIAETFFDPDPGDVLAYEARLANGAPLPRWLAFDCAAARLTGIAPEDVAFEERIEIIAIDMDGATASAVFTMRRAVF